MASRKKSKRRPHDQAFKAIFTHPRMIEDTLRGYAVHPFSPLDPSTVAAIDFASLDKLTTEWISDDFRRRQGDQVWRVRWHGADDWSDPRNYLLILTEFQSQQEPSMALRMVGYTHDLYRELEATGVVRAGGPFPPVFPMVIHNGLRPWTASTRLSVASPPRLPATGKGAAGAAASDVAAFQLCLAYFLLDFDPYRGDDPRLGNAMSTLIGLDRPRHRAEVVAHLGLLQALDDEHLEQTMLAWTLRRLGIRGARAKEIMAMAGLDNFHSHLEEQAKGWIEEWLAQGRAEGVAQSVAQSVAQARAMLKRQAALKFGAHAEVLTPLLDQVHSQEQLAEMGEWLIVDTFEPLVAKVEAALDEDRPA